MRRAVSVIAAAGIVAAACSTGVPADVVNTTPVTTIASVVTTAAVPATTAPRVTSTAVPDTEPPQLTIVDPAEGTAVTTRKYEFRGMTEPGATVVAAGRYEVDVGEDGSWSILLVLDRGGNLALFTATDAAGNTTEERMTVVYEPPITSPDYWTGRTVGWERSGIGRWAAVTFTRTTPLRCRRFDVFGRGVTCPDAANYNIDGNYRRNANEQDKATRYPGQARWSTLAGRDLRYR